jgi:predicted membrane chloride channel (bestrophin family)
MIFISRDVASRLLCAVEPVDAAVRDERERALRLLLTYAKSLKYHLTIDGCNQHIEIDGCTDAEIRGAKDAALRDELACVWLAPAQSASGGAGSPAPDTLPDRLVRTSVGHRPLFVLHELGLLLRRLLRSGHLSELDAVQLNERLLGLVRVVGGCERLFRTPIYTPYNHHTSRFLLLWTVALPAALFPVLGPVATAPVSLLMAWGMLGIEDIGSRIENPMDSLPLWQYVDTVEQSLEQLRAHDSEARQLSGGAGDGSAALGSSAPERPSN